LLKPGVPESKNQPYHYLISLGMVLPANPGPGF
jgi:hypothetical protein